MCTLAISAVRKWIKVLGVVVGASICFAVSTQSAHAQDPVTYSFPVVCPQDDGTSSAADGRMSSEVHAAGLEVGLAPIACAGTIFEIEPASAVDVNAIVQVLDGFVMASSAPLLGGAEANATLRLSVHLNGPEGEQLCTHELVLDKKNSTGGGFAGNDLRRTQYLLSCHGAVDVTTVGTTIFAKVEARTFATAVLAASADARINADLVSIGIVPYCEEVDVEATEGTVPLFSWYSPSQKDIWVTSNPAFAGCRGKVTHGDYHFVRLEGFVLDPSLPQPFGTLPLVSLFSEGNADNYVTADPEMLGRAGTTTLEGDSIIRLEGFVYDPRLHAPIIPGGTVPLHSYVSEKFSDRFATTRSFWRNAFSDPRTGIGASLPPARVGETPWYDTYVVSQLEGYIYDPARRPPVLTVPPSVRPEDLLPEPPWPIGLEPAIEHDLSSGLEGSLPEAPMPVEGPSAREVRLVSWWSDALGDNFATADPAWIGELGAMNSEGYRLYRIEGRIYSPQLPQPVGTVPLVSWWSERRGDRITTTDQTWQDSSALTHWPDYVFSRVEGYIHDPDLPQPDGTVPLVSWWSDDREDNFATTDPNWRIEAGLPETAGYRLYRIEGYINP